MKPNVLDTPETSTTLKFFKVHGVQFLELPSPTCSTPYIYTDFACDECVLFEEKCTHPSYGDISSSLLQQLQQSHPELFI